ncbi:MAG: hypothetical protein ACREX8_14185, partial [Gammaproteobacteria bacterium]
MRIRSILRGLAVCACVIAGVIALAPASSAAPSGSADAARLAAAGIDVSTLRPGWSVVGDFVSWDHGDVML